jgi:zinc transport system substrate-binding protein
MKYLIVFLLVPLYALNVAVSILPQKYIIKAIAKDKVNVVVMVPPGTSPATYSLNFKNLKALKNSKIYFTIGVPFEKKYLKKIVSFSNVEVIDFAKYIKTTNNPHIWLSPALLMLQAKVVLDTLIEIDRKNKSFYLKNYQEYILKLANLEKEGFQKIKYNSFITFHPSFFYFAKDFHLKEIALEKEGKSPSFSYIKKVLELAKKYKIKRVIISPEFPTKYAEIIANKIGAKVYIISPLKKPITTIKTLIKALQ